MMIHHRVRDRSLRVANAFKCAGRLEEAFKKWREHCALNQIGNVIHYHCHMTGLALEAIGINGLPDDLAIALEELELCRDDLLQGKGVRDQFEENIEYLAQVVSAIPAALDTRPRLNETDRAIAELVYKQEPLRGKEIVARLLPDMEITEQHLRRIFSDKLKPYGFHNDGDGYRAPTQKTWN